MKPIVLLAVILFAGCNKIEPPPPDPDADPDRNAFVGDIAKLPTVIKSAKPVYPKLQRDAGYEATVWLDVLIDKHGVPLKAIKTEIHGTRYKLDKFNDTWFEATAGFEEPAIAAAMKYRFTPAITSGGDTLRKSWLPMLVRFRL
jgi:hypothetical protein